MSYFPCDIPYMSHEELEENGIRIPKNEVMTNDRKTQLSEESTIFDTISRQAAVELVMKYCPDDDGAVQCDGDIRELLDELENLPPTQPERKKGKWVKIPGMNEYCSACNRFFPLLNFQGSPFEINYCPHCGADMRGDKDETD